VTQTSKHSQSPAPKTIFLTGATGLVGSYAARWLVSRGHEVRALVRPESRLDLLAEARDKVAYVQGDLSDWEALERGMRGADAVVHAAGMVSMDMRKKRQLRQINAEATALMTHVALDVGVPHFAFISSIAAIGRSTDEQHIDEETAWQDSPYNSVYARSKFAGEREVWRAGEEGLPFSIINPAVVLGAGFWKESSASFFRQVYKGLPFMPGGSTAFVDVRDLAQLIGAVVEGGPTGERLIAAAENASWREVIAVTARCMDRPSPGRAMPDWLGTVAPTLARIQRLFSGGEPLVTSESLRLAQAKYTYHTGRAKERYGFAYRSLEETIRESVGVFLKTFPQGKNWGVLGFFHGEKDGI
jgi:dihydroflavonol-4-reductase